MKTDHDARVVSEIQHYEKRQASIHELPGIFHYWSQKFLGPHVTDIFGHARFFDLFVGELMPALVDSANHCVISVGSGDASIERVIASRLIERGLSNVRFHCLELNPHLIERGRAGIEEAGLSSHFEFFEVDLSTWGPDRVYGAAFAHHSLHHIVALEHVFNQVRAALEPAGVFVISDMIGRNGHMRWPETLAILEQIWRSVPARYRFHHRLDRVIDPYENWDCSGVGFEGIRAQDIMACLAERFSFRRMCVWGGVLDPIIDRGFGPNLDPADPVDTLFVDRLWALDCALLSARAATPTQIIATMTKASCSLERSSFGLTPQECVRLPQVHG